MTELLCSREMVARTIDILRLAGERRRERVVLWLGSSRQAQPAGVMEVYEPDQITKVDRFHLPPASMAALMAHLKATRRRILAQIHTHPGRAYHSDIDAEWAIIRHVGALSLVLPEFAANTTPDNFVQRAAIYAYSAEGEWVERSNAVTVAPIQVIL